MPRKHPFLIDLNTGAVGAFIRVEKGTKAGHVNIVYAPLGIKGALKHERIFNVLEASMPGVMHSPSPSQAGVQESGYMILPKGQDGKSQMLDVLGVFLDKQMKKIHDTAQEAKMGERTAASRARARAEGLKKELEEISETRETLEKKERWPDTLPWRRRPYEEEGGEY